MTNIINSSLPITSTTIMRLECFSLSLHLSLYSGLDEEKKKEEKNKEGESDPCVSQEGVSFNKKKYILVAFYH
jgi:hypothetical protein